jgi:hypothetical protein
MTPEPWRVLNAVDELEDVHRIIFQRFDGVADTTMHEALIRMRRALAVLHAHVKEAVAR